MMSADGCYAFNTLRHDDMLAGGGKGAEATPACHDAASYATRRHDAITRRDATTFVILRYYFTPSADVYLCRRDD